MKRYREMTEIYEGKPSFSRGRLRSYSCTRNPATESLFFITTVSFRRYLQIAMKTCSPRQHRICDLCRAYPCGGFLHR